MPALDTPPGSTPAPAPDHIWRAVEFNSRKNKCFLFGNLVTSHRMTLQPPFGTGSTSTEPSPLGVVQTLWETETT